MLAWDRERTAKATRYVHVAKVQVLTHLAEGRRRCVRGHQPAQAGLPFWCYPVARSLYATTARTSPTISYVTQGVIAEVMDDGDEALASAWRRLAHRIDRYLMRMEADDRQPTWLESFYILKALMLLEMGDFEEGERAMEEAPRAAHKREAGEQGPATTLYDLQTRLTAIAKCQGGHDQPQALDLQPALSPSTEQADQRLTLAPLVRGATSLR